MKKIVILVLISAGLMMLSGCEQKTPEEKAKESIEQAAKDTAAAVKEGAQNAEEAVKKVMKCQTGKCGQGKCGGK